MAEIDQQQQKAVLVVSMTALQEALRRSVLKIYEKEGAKRHDRLALNS